jgi:hypothetical protein
MLSFFSQVKSAENLDLSNHPPHFLVKWVENPYISNHVAHFLVKSSQKTPQT